MVIEGSLYWQSDGGRIRASYGLGGDRVNL